MSESIYFFPDFTVCWYIVDLDDIIKTYKALYYSKNN